MNKLILCLLFASQTYAGSILPRGNAAWVYDLNAGTSMVGASAQWSTQIAQFNAGAGPDHPIKTIYSYGGDMEYYPTSNYPYQTYFPVQNQLAAQIYKTTLGVENVVIVIDGLMDNSAPYNPNFNNLTTAQIQLWADRTANLFCSFDYVDGLQIDLEPVNAGTTTNYQVFIARLAVDLSLVQNNCVNSLHPYGRSLGAFMFASAATPSIFQALGPNGYVITSEYDLGNAPAGTPNTIAQYMSALTSDLQLLINNAKAGNGSFVIGIPGGASTHEFTQYVPLGGSPVAGFPMYSDSAPSYIGQAVPMIHSMLGGNLRWLGTALWGFSPELDYPNHSGNQFIPNTPFAQTGEMKYLQLNL